MYFKYKTTVRTILTPSGYPFNNGFSILQKVFSAKNFSLWKQFTIFFCSEFAKFSDLCGILSVHKYPLVVNYNNVFTSYCTVQNAIRLYNMSVIFIWNHNFIQNKNCFAGSQYSQKNDARLAGNTRVLIFHIFTECAFCTVAKTGLSLSYKICQLYQPWSWGCWRSGHTSLATGATCSCCNKKRWGQDLWPQGHSLSSDCTHPPGQTQTAEDTILTLGVCRSAAVMNPPTLPISWRVGKGKGGEQ